MFDAGAHEAWSVPAPAALRVAQSPDGRLVVAALRDGTVRWYRASDGVELLALFLHADGKRWVAFTPSGYYAASPGGEDLVGWQVDNGPDRAADFFPASKFRDRFYRPDVVSLVLKTLDEAEAVQQAEAATAQHEAPTPAPDAAAPKQAVLTDQPPAVTILSPPPGAQLSGDSAELQVEVRSQTGRPITSVEARVNARPAPGVEISEAQAMPAAQGETVERRRIVVPVPAGETATLQVIARSGDRASEAAILEVKGRIAQPEPAAAPPVAGLPTLAPVRIVLDVARGRCWPRPPRGGYTAGVSSRRARGRRSRPRRCSTTRTKHRLLFPVGPQCSRRGKPSARASARRRGSGGDPEARKHSGARHYRDCDPLKHAPFTGRGARVDVRIRARPGPLFGAAGC